MFTVYISCMQFTVFNICLTDCVSQGKAGPKGKQRPPGPMGPKVNKFVHQHNKKITKRVNIISPSLLFIQGIPGLTGEKGESAMTGPKVKVRHTVLHLSFSHVEYVFTYVICI